MESHPQLDLVIKGLLLIRKASSAVEVALGLPPPDRDQLDAQVNAVRRDLGRVVTQVSAAIPGAGALGRRPEVKMAAGIVEFIARQGATQLGAVAGVADTLHTGSDSRSLAQRIERYVAEVGVASRADLAEVLGVDQSSNELQEAIERALGSGRAEWYGPGVYGLPRGQLEALGGQPAATTSESSEQKAPEPELSDEAESEPGSVPQLQAAVRSLEGSLRALGTALRGAGAERSDSDRIQDLRRLADDGAISRDEYERRRQEILGSV
jgi:hypothetical protein